MRQELLRRESEKGKTFTPALAKSAIVSGNNEQSQVGGVARMEIGFFPFDPYIRRGI